MSYVDVPITTDPDQIRQDIYEAIQTKFPDWEPSEANIEVWLVEGFAAFAADLRQLAADVPPAVFRKFGQEIFGIEPVDELQATVASTWTVVDNAGYTIEAGTQVVVYATGDTPVGFEVMSDVTIPPGSTSTAAGGVMLQAVQAGSVANGLSGTAQPQNSVAWLNTITLSGTSTGGADAETDEEYIAKLARRLRRMGPHAVMASEAADAALDISGVYRALAVDNYNPADGTTNNQRMTSIAGVDSTGANLSAGKKTEVLNYLATFRELNFIFNMFDPTRTTIDVTATVRCYPKFDTVLVDAAVTQAITDYFSPLNWGRPVFSEQQDWRKVTTVRYSELVALVNSVDGVDYIESMTMRTGANAFATTDIALTGQAPLTQAGVITVTANPAT